MPRLVLIYMYILSRWWSSQYCDSHNLQIKMNIHVHVSRLNHHEKINMTAFLFLRTKCLCLPWMIGVIFCFVLSGVGYGICLVSTLVGMYYNTIIAWGVFYMFASFRSEVPWAGCNNSWNTENCMSLSTNFNKSLITNFTLTASDEYYTWVLHANYFSRKGVQICKLFWNIFFMLLHF